MDVLQNDRFGRLGLSLQGLAERDRMVFEKVKQTDQPLVVVMGGGYNRDPQMTVAGHAQTYRLAPRGARRAVTTSSPAEAKSIPAW